jgi:hypothetical protein
VRIPNSGGRPLAMQRAEKKPAGSAGFVSLTQLGRNATAAAHLETVSHCPLTNLGGISGAGSLGNTATPASGGPRTKTPGSGLICLKRAAQLFRVSRGEVDLVLATIETETDALVSGSTL